MTPRPPSHTYATIDIMAFIKEPLIIIPGLGDRANLYSLLIPVWKLLGYEPYIFSFGWEDADENFAAAIKRLVDYIDNLQTTRVNIIGVSAGGTAAVNVLAERRQMVRRVVTIATPYKYIAHLDNGKLKASIDCMKKSMNGANTRARILSMYGLYDQTVPTNVSKPEGVRTKKLYAVNHGCIIAVALVVHCFSTRRFLEKD